MLRVGSVVLAVVGLGLLYLASIHRELPVKSVGAITPSMNYAAIRIVGTVTRDCYVGERDGVVDYASFVVDDGTGSIRVKARGRVARELAQAGRLPVAGVTLDVAGSVGVAEGKDPELWVRSARQLRVGVPQT